MIEIIPNWHPLLVHFTIGILSCSVLFYVASYAFDLNFRLERQWIHVANWTLWTGCLFTIFTVLAGWHAYNTVAHDDVAHAAMTLHRNWAIPTALAFLLLGVAALRTVKRNRKPAALFISSSIIALLMLMTTGWLGAEVVYRHGLGVMSLPNTQEEHHHHAHEANEEASSPHTDDEETMPMPVEEHNHADHQH